MENSRIETLLNEKFESVLRTIVNKREKANRGMVDYCQHLKERGFIREFAVSPIKIEMVKISPGIKEPLNWFSQMLYKTGFVEKYDWYINYSMKINITRSIPFHNFNVDLNYCEKQWR